MIKTSYINSTDINTPSTTTSSSDTFNRDKFDRGVRLLLVVACAYLETYQLKELPLQKFIEIWGVLLSALLNNILRILWMLLR